MSNFYRQFLTNCTKFIQTPCLLCGAFTPYSHGICNPCWNAFPPPPPVWQEKDHPSVWAGSWYWPPIQGLLHGLKYRQQLQVLPLCSALLLRGLQKAPRPDALLAMPLHPARLRERGFNQAFLLAQALGHLQHLPVLAPESVIRHQYQPALFHLGRRERWKQMADAFACHHTWQGEHIAVIDDIFTTGASSYHLARCLQAAGVGCVSIWVVARAY